MSDIVKHDFFFISYAAWQNQVRWCFIYQKLCFTKLLITLHHSENFVSVEERFNLRLYVRLFILTFFHAISYWHITHCTKYADLQHLLLRYYFLFPFIRRLYRNWCASDKQDSGIVLRLKSGLQSRIIISFTLLKGWQIVLSWPLLCSGNTNTDNSFAYSSMKLCKFIHFRWLWIWRYTLRGMLAPLIVGYLPNRHSIDLWFFSFWNSGHFCSWAAKDRSHRRIDSILFPYLTLSLFVH